jgi:hypothetical protein
MARKTFCTLEPKALAMAAAGLFCCAINTDATALGNEVPMAHTVMPRFLGHGEICLGDPGSV